MGFIDSFKMALHNLWHNKSRTLLTIIIVFVVSTLIMAMCLLGTNFISNQEDINRKMFSESGTSYDTTGKVVSSPRGGWDTLPIWLEEAKKIADVSRKHINVVDSFSIKGDYVTVYSGEKQEHLTPAYADFTFPFGRAVGTIKEGRLWTAADKDKANIWVSDTTVESLSAQGIACGVGDKLNITITESTQSIDDYLDGGRPNNPDDEYLPPKTFTDEYTVAGVIKASAIDNDNRYGNSSAQIYISLDHALKGVSNISIQSLNILYNPVGGSYSYSTVQKSMQTYVKDVQTLLGVNTFDGGRVNQRFESSFLSMLSDVRLMGYLIMGVLALLALIILLLSVGSVANTIIISVDKNRKFIGLMKAMGLNNRGVKGIVYKEAFITITLGVILAIALILAISPLLSFALNSIMGGLFMMVEQKVTITFVLHAYIPAITVFAFVGLALLFSRGAVNRMGKADVISIISEVA